MALVLAIMVFASMSAFAATSIKNDSTNHTYEVFQIYTGTVSGNQLTNLKKGVSHASYDATPEADNGLSQTELTYLAGLSDNDRAADQTDIANLASYVDLTKPMTGITIAPGATVDVPTGYYLLRDTSTSPSDDATSKTLYLMQVVDGVSEIKPKDSTVTSDKEVKDINDTTDTAAGDWQKSADWDIGDKVPFRLTATLPSNYTDYKTYHLTFHDTEDVGLTFDKSSVKVYLDNSTTPVNAANYTVVTEDIGTETFQVVFTHANLTAIGVTNSSVLHVEYESELNASAKIGGAEGNVNTSNVTFDNNPNSDQDGEEGGKTPDKTAIVFTYKTVVNKVDENGKSLTGAEFTLVKNLKDGSTKNIAVVKFTASGVETTKVADGTTTSEGDATKFVFNGLDDGTYVLTETVVPAGYNKIDAVTFVINATHTANDGTKAALTKLEGADQADGEVKLTFTEADDHGSLNADVKNQSGVTLPSTGGIGTTIFYIAGSILVLAAAILLITKRRMGSEE